MVAFYEVLFIFGKLVGAQWNELIVIVHDYSAMSMVCMYI